MERWCACTQLPNAKNSRNPRNLACLSLHLLDSLLDLSLRKGGREGLLQLVSLSLVLHGQGVQVTAASDLELDVVGVLLDGAI